MTREAPSPATVGAVANRRQAPDPDERYRRGDIWMVLADPSQPAVGNELWSNRPAVIVSNNVLNARSGIAQVVYLSTAARKRSGPTHVELPAIDGSGGTAMALCEQIHTVDASRLQRKLGHVSEEHVRELDAAMALSLSIGRNPNSYGLFRKWEEHVKLHGIDIAEEINALSGLTTDQRVESLTRALKLVAAERDAFQTLFESMPARAGALGDVSAALAGEHSPTP